MHPFNTFHFIVIQNLHTCWYSTVQNQCLVFHAHTCFQRCCSCLLRCSILLHIPAGLLTPKLVSWSIYLLERCYMVLVGHILWNWDACWCVMTWNDMKVYVANHMLTKHPGKCQEALCIPYGADLSWGLTKHPCNGTPVWVRIDRPLSKYLKNTKSMKMTWQHIWNGTNNTIAVTSNSPNQAWAALRLIP